MLEIRLKILLFGFVSYIERSQTTAEARFMQVHPLSSLLNQIEYDSMQLGSDLSIRLPVWST